MLGQVVDSSGLDAILDPRRAANVWLITAREASTPLYLPSLALTEVRALRTPAATPEALTELYELLEHPSVVRRDLDPSTAAEVAALLADTSTFDVGTGHVCVIARQRGWPVITSDPGRLRRVDPDVDVLLV
ncbi:PIN domain-containing protein [Actinomycetospora chiangmaiensis]|uniref:PIN domain-containing protein n=1 Tax=Actinomycetospora chiangmaiensis TaxID=402650 RepID=UPI0003692CC5|nr:PIN domain-containing protein [Actinomycetospora chiangmaiensis]